MYVGRSGHRSQYQKRPRFIKGTPSHSRTLFKRYCGAVSSSQVEDRRKPGTRMLGRAGRPNCSYSEYCRTSDSYGFQHISARRVEREGGANMRFSTTPVSQSTMFRPAKGARMTGISDGTVHTVLFLVAPGDRQDRQAEEQHISPKELASSSLLFWPKETWSELVSLLANNQWWSRDNSR